MPRSATQRVERVAKKLPDVKSVERKAEKRNKVRPATEHHQREQKVKGKAIRNQAHIDAVLDPSTLDDWDEEELERGYRRDKNGNFCGRPPKYIPFVVAMELSRRAKIQQLVNLSKLGPTAMRTLQSVMKDSRNDLARVAAAKLIVERLLPLQSLTEIDVNVKVEPLFLKALEAGIVSVGDDDIIDAEVIDSE